MFFILLMVLAGCSTQPPEPTPLEREIAKTHGQIVDEIHNFDKSLRQLCRHPEMKKDHACIQLLKE
jgi:hypothetical protein